MLPWVGIGAGVADAWPGGGAPAWRKEGPSRASISRQGWEGPFSAQGPGELLPVLAGSPELVHAPWRQPLSTLLTTWDWRSRHGFPPFATFLWGVQIPSWQPGVVPRPESGFYPGSRY